MRTRYASALKFIVVLFCVITTAQVVLIMFTLWLTNLAIMGNEARVWAKVLALSAATSLPVLVLVSKETASILENRTRRVMHFILTGGATFVMLLNYRWLTWNTAIVIIIVFAVIFIAGSLLWSLHEKSVANQLNRRIREAQNKKTSSG